jgi:hypothetical protein
MSGMWRTFRLSLERPKNKGRMQNTSLLVPPRWWQNFFYAIVATLACRPALSQHQHLASEFDVFVAAEGVAGHGQPRPRDDDPWFNADVVFGLTHGQFRIFGEYFITSEEHDLERFQVGYEVIPDTVAWVGRFHQPASAWDTEHHHGRYLQTAITRPAIENWEDEDGLIPQHITGALVESSWPILTEAGLKFAAGAGAGPALTHEDNEPFDLLRSNPGRHGPAFMGRLAFLPDYAGTSSAGLLFSHDELFAERHAVRTSRLNHVRLAIYGAYEDWTLKNWRLISALYYIDVGLDRPNPNESFVSGYVQFERGLPHELTAFARLEDSARMQRSQYVRQLDAQSSDIDEAIRRQTGGLRWDYAPSQALTIEFGHEVSITGRGYEVRLQWSAVVP